jgi:hypothetical protein
MQQYQHSADYIYLDAALKSQWELFENIYSRAAICGFFGTNEMTRHEAKLRKSARLLNRHMSQAERDSVFRKTISELRAKKFGVEMELHTKLLSSLVSTLLLSHALCEALINSFLTIGFCSRGAPDLAAAAINNCKFLDKWTDAPKAFNESYKLNKGGSLYETLKKLTEQRNSITHYKIQLVHDNQTLSSGALFEAYAPAEAVKWINRFFSLPYDLGDHLRRSVHKPKCIALMDSEPIPRCTLHFRKDEIGLAAFFHLERDTLPNPINQQI